MQHLIEDMMLYIDDARTLADIIRMLAEGEIAGSGGPPPRLYRFLSDELDSRFEQMTVEVQSLSKGIAPASEPPPMPPLSDAEIALKTEISTTLREASTRLRQRNLDRAVLLARQAAEGTGPLVDHFAELGRRFKPEAPAEQVEGGAA